MNDLERLWRERNDGSLLEAIENLDDYTDEAQRVILAEMARRGLKLPEPAAEDDEDAEEAVVEREAENREALVEVPPLGVLACVRCGLELELLGTVELPGEREGLLTAIAQMLDGEDSLNVYKCPQCGHLDFYAEAADGENEESRE